MIQKIVPILLFEGPEAEVWLLSGKNYPKKIAKLVGREALFQASVKQLFGLNLSAPLVVPIDAFCFIISEQLEAIGMPLAGILIELGGRDTGPAVIPAALQTHRSDPEAILLVAPHDNVIPDTDHFQTCVRAALPHVETGQVVTFGVTAGGPKTGYDYPELTTEMTAEFISVSLKSFIEKPNEADATAMISRGCFLWSSGIFLFSVKSIISSFETHAPPTSTTTRKVIEYTKSDLVAHKDHAQGVKQAESTLKTKQVPQAETFPKNQRPQGLFESLAAGGVSQ